MVHYTRGTSKYFSLDDQVKVYKCFKWKMTSDIISKVGSRIKNRILKEVLSIPSPRSLLLSPLPILSTPPLPPLISPHPFTKLQAPTSYPRALKEKNQNCIHSHNMLSFLGLLLILKSKNQKVLQTAVMNQNIEGKHQAFLKFIID